MAGHIAFTGSRGAMASPWRRRRLCVIDWDDPSPAALTHISGRGARIETSATPRRGTLVGFRHPVAGSIEGVVSEIGRGSIVLAFDGSPRAVAFALAAIAADMTHGD